ncbi:MAG: hypothetical protein ACYC6N_31650, partial [Pirellulaceae bacterium]
MSRPLQLAIGFCLASAFLPTEVRARGFAGVPVRGTGQDADTHFDRPAPNVSRGFQGFPAGGIGGFAGGHMVGMHPLGMPGRNEFDTLHPVTLPNLGANGRLHPYGMPPTGAHGDF